MEQTKEQILIGLAKVRQSHSEWVESNEKRKQEFAKIFGWHKPHSSYWEERLPMTPSWEQIFTEVGKLLATRNFYDFEGNLSELERRLEDLEKKIKQEIHPNL